jgi:hypothetical protein
VFFKESNPGSLGSRAQQDIIAMEDEDFLDEDPSTTVCILSTVTSHWY